MLRARTALDQLKLDEEEQIGVNVVRKALSVPICQIAENAGLDGTVVQHKVAEKTGAFGYNAETGQYTDLVKDGVIDPTKVVRIALQNASSVARILLSSECLITAKPEDKKKDKHSHGHPGMGEEDYGGMGGMGGMDMM